MAQRWGLGPVFVYEWQNASRRWRMYAGRAAFVALLLAILMLFGRKYLFETQVNRGELAELGQTFFFSIVITQLAVVLLAAPAATAGSICTDKACGLLTHMLVSDLSNVEIVLGKLGARLLPVLGLILAGAPVPFLCMLFGGIDPEALFGAYLVTVGTAFLGCSLALTLSVWGKRTHEVLLVNYLVWILILLAPAFAWTIKRALWAGMPTEWADWINPFNLAVAPYSDIGGDYLPLHVLFLGLCLALSVMLTAMSAARVRAVALRQAGAPSKRGWWRTLRDRMRFRFRRFARWLPGPSLDRNPVLWREWHRQRPSGWTALVWLMYATLAAAFTAWSIWVPNTPSVLWVGAVVNGLQVGVGFLFLTIAAASSMAEERVRGSLDVLLATPLTTFSILWGKWWGTFRTALWLILLPSLMVFVSALKTEEWVVVALFVGLLLAYGVFFTSLGLLIAIETRRLGKAVAVAVVFYAFISIGWIFLAMSFAGAGPEETALMMVLGSPFYGPGLGTAAITTEFPMELLPMFRIGSAIWIVGFLALSICLMLYNLLTFNFFMGRMSQGWLLRAERIWTGRIVPTVRRLRFWRWKVTRENRPASADVSA